ncbi:hypothetical protein [Selenomonas sp. AE3005]|uniref:hypothetical protein n=1 Tax=Selenomonas sp. AE3005 TaxID=1485543 RepID=UPI0025FFCB6E|nr:hypothetical protein [Selenomonas sp. AE3005]
MKKVLPLLLLLLITLSAVAFAEQGQVVYYNTNRQSVVIATASGYTCGEVTMFRSGFWELSRGDMLAGDLNSYGSHDVYDLSRDRMISLWIDDVMLSQDAAFDWIQNH